MSDNSKGPAAGEYPIRARILPGADLWDTFVEGQEINVRKDGGGYSAFDPKHPDPDSDFYWHPKELEILPPLTAPAVPEPKAEGPDPLVEALEAIDDEIRIQEEHFAEVNLAAMAGSRMHEGEARVTGDVILGLQYARKRVAALSRTGGAQ